MIKKLVPPKNRGAPVPALLGIWKEMNRIRASVTPRFKTAFKCPKGTNLPYLMSKLEVQKGLVVITDATLLTRSEVPVLMDLRDEYQDWVDDQKKIKEAGESK